MGDKRETRTDLPKREFDADLNDETFSNKDAPPVDQRDSDHIRDHIGNPSEPTPLEELQGDGDDKGKDNDEHDVGNADNLSR